MLGPDDTVLCSGTLRTAGFREKVEAAAAHGFRGLSLWIDDVEKAHAEGLDDADIRALLADHGLVVAELDPLLSWLQRGPLEVAAPDATRLLGRSEAEFFALADAVGGGALNLAHPFDGEVAVDRAAEALAGVADRAREHGLVVLVEFLPWTDIADVTKAAAIVDAAGRANAAVMLDTWHFSRGANDLDALRALPGECIGGVQINGVPAEPRGAAPLDSMHNRLLPDEGASDIAAIVRALDAIGSRAPIGVEVFSKALDVLAPDEAAGRCAAATRRVLEAARA